MIPNMHDPVILNLYDGFQSFYLPYGKRMVSIQSQMCNSNLYMEIKSNSKIEEVPVTIIYYLHKSTWNIIKCSMKTAFVGRKDNLLEISARCTVESIIAASFELTPCKMQSDYRNMFSLSEAGDITIAVDGKTLRVHKSVLSASCPVFAAMLNQEWTEKATVTIKDFDYKTILAMIEFIYFGGCDVDCGEEAADPIDRLKAAHMYQLDHLKDSREQRLCQNLKKSIISSYIELADAYDLMNLRSEVFAIKINDQDD